MDKKKIYIIVIIVCVAIAAGVLYWGNMDPSTSLPDNIAPISTNIDRVDPPTGGATAGGILPLPDQPTDYIPPRVFPQDTQINLGVFSSPKFTSLTDYVPLTVQPEEVGRENPFVKY